MPCCRRRLQWRCGAEAVICARRARSVLSELGTHPAARASAVRLLGCLSCPLPTRPPALASTAPVLKGDEGAAGLGRTRAEAPGTGRRRHEASEQGAAAHARAMGSSLRVAVLGAPGVGRRHHRQFCSVTTTSACRPGLTAPSTAAGAARQRRHGRAFAMATVPRSSPRGRE